MREMISRYATCATYEDRGESVTTFAPHDGSRARRLVIAFETAFDRTRGGFRFEYRASGLTHEKRCIVWRSAPGVARVWWSQSMGEAQGELDSLLAVHAGTSAGISTMVPALLFGRALPFSFREASKEEAAWKIEAIGRPLTMWCTIADPAIFRWEARHRRVRLGTLFDHPARNVNVETETLYASVITQSVTLDAAFDRALATERFSRV